MGSIMRTRRASLLGWPGALVLLLILNTGLKVLAWQRSSVPDPAPRIAPIGDLPMVQLKEDGKPGKGGEDPHHATVPFPLLWLMGLLLLDVTRPILAAGVKRTSRPC